MKKRCKSLPKHVRLVKDLLERLGAAAISVSANARYILTWMFGGVAMRVCLPLSPKGNAVEAARGNVRRLFRQHGFAVPA